MKKEEQIGLNWLSNKMFLVKIFIVCWKETPDKLQKVHYTVRPGLVSIKNVRSQERDLFIADEGERGFFKYGRPNFFVPKNVRFIKNGMSARTSGYEGWAMQTFCGQGERGKFFAILCGRFLRTASKFIFNENASPLLMLNQSITTMNSQP